MPGKIEAILHVWERIVIFPQIRVKVVKQIGGDAQWHIRMHTPKGHARTPKITPHTAK